jgi:hypothetical protein
MIPLNCRCYPEKAWLSSSVRLLRPHQKDDVQPTRLLLGNVLYPRYSSLRIMTAALEEQIKHLAKQTEDSSRDRLRGLSQTRLPGKAALKTKKDLATRMDALRDSLLDGLREFEGFFWYTLGPDNGRRRSMERRPRRERRICCRDLATNQDKLSVDAQRLARS